MTHAATVPVEIENVPFGANDFVLLAGPCSIESHEQLFRSADFLNKMKVPLMRGGIFKLRTSPHSFQGLGRELEPLLKEYKAHYELPLISEITDPRQLDWMLRYVDGIQVGTRNMYNYELLKELGKNKVPVLLKRAFSATLKEWLLAADYLRTGGNNNVILCERGIRSFDDTTRNVLDLGAVAYLKAHCELPIVVDPSHAVGDKSLVLPLSLAAAAMGCDGLMIETHPNPQVARSDADQALNFNEFEHLYFELEKVLASRGRKLFKNEKSRNHSKDVFLHSASL